MFNQKGGVGKTTSTYELGYNLSRMGFRVLMVDADPQASLATTINPHISESLEEGLRYSSSLEEKFDQGRGELSRIDHIFYRSIQSEPDVTPSDDDYIKKVTILPVHKYSNLYYIPGALEFGVLSDVVSMGTMRVRGTEKFALMIPTVFRAIARMNRIDMVLMDLNPSVDAINRSIIMKSDYLWIPFKPSLGCLDSAKNLLRLIPKWFVELRDKNLVAPGEGPLLLNSFPQVLKANVVNKQSTQQPHISIRVLEKAYASWIRPILDRTSELQEAFRQYVPSQPIIPFPSMFENIIGVPDMAGRGLNIQRSGRPASDLTFQHKKATSKIDSKNNKEKMANFNKADDELKLKVNIAYKRIIGFALKFLSEEHKRVLRQRVPNYELMLALYEKLMADRIVFTQAERKDLELEDDAASSVMLDEVAPPASKRARAAHEVQTRWYTDDDITTLLTDKLVDPKFGFVTPLAITEAYTPLDLEEHIAEFIRRFVLDFDTSQSSIFWTFIPINVNGNHWTVVSIHCDPANRTAQVFYFDPMAGRIEAETKTSIDRAFSRIFPDIPLGPYQALNVRVQSDGHNCGPWIVEAVEHLASRGHLDNLREVDIALVRQQHASLLQPPGGRRDKGRRTER